MQNELEMKNIISLQFSGKYILSLPLCSISLGLLCTCPDDIYPFAPSSSCDLSLLSPALVLPKPMDEGETAKNNKDKIIQNKLEMKNIISLLLW